jgi:uncharacterized protein DUF2513
MKRDLELIRKMLLTIEEADSGWAPSDLKLDGYTDAQIGYHAHLLIDAGLAHGDDVTTMGSEAPEGKITSLTWAGHEFVEAARDEGRWKRAMGTVADSPLLGGHRGLHHLSLGGHGMIPRSRSRTNPTNAPPTNPTSRAFQSGSRAV